MIPEYSVKWLKNTIMPNSTEIGISHFFSFIVATKHASINLMLFMKLYICGIYTSAFNNLGRTVITVKNIFRGHTFSKWVCSSASFFMFRGWLLCHHWPLVWYFPYNWIKTYCNMDSCHNCIVFCLKNAENGKRSQQFLFQPKIGISRFSSLN